MHLEQPRVSVVIPTFQRPKLVTRAVRAALSQTETALEVLVVIDGRDEATTEALQKVSDPRVRLLHPPRRLGNGGARNYGVARAHAKWVAFLDDDDEWAPNKLELQLKQAEQSPLRHPIVACRVTSRNERGDAVWPRRFPTPGEPLSEYLYCRKTPFTGEGIVITSMILTARELLERIPFSESLSRFVDDDWVLRATREPGAELEFVPDPRALVTWYTECDRARITNAVDWRETLAYARENRGLFTPRGYAAFLLHAASSDGAAAREWKAFPTLIREAFQHGRPSRVDMASHVGNYLIPASVKQTIALLYAKASSSRRKPG